eukprot:TRINITY_DN3813_c0_g1_i3.p1 TRINITY_DN3813_c0_g1~~TRINITY_DN3813_c0_g1_i3.p1  ORF type:complete len:221 (+),score=72.56 TRINITY_DN3813_c0_g1_i3:60-665(+)
MFAALGIVAADLLTGKDGIQQLGLGAFAERNSRVTLRATVADGNQPPAWSPADEVGVTAPLGFFDPIGFSKSKADFRNLRIAEIKHGRVAMMATLGAVIQHYVKLPGFENVPAGLGALTVEPGDKGFDALIVLAGVMELAVWTQDGKKEPGNFGDPAGLGMYTEEMRNKELNNGRMAMVAAFGILTAESFTGKDGMQQLGF